MHSIENNRILLIEDHVDLAETLVDFLETLGCIVDYAADGLSGLHLATTQEFDAIVLDVMLPGMDGLALCQKIRAQKNSTVPVLMITARDELNDKLLGFEAGADDYLLKPFELPELVARISSLVRRNKGQLNSSVLRVGDLEVDLIARQVVRAGTELTLTPAGIQILEILMRQSPKVVSLYELESQLWGENPPSSDSLRSQIYKLRKQIDRPFASALIRTVTGLGYQLIAENGTDQ